MTPNRFRSLAVDAVAVLLALSVPWWASRVPLWISLPALALSLASSAANHRSRRASPDPTDAR